MKSLSLLQVKVLSGERTAHAGSYGGGWSGQPGHAKPSGQKAAQRRSATPRAGTRVNPEQAPKGCCGRRSALNTEKAAAPGPSRPSWVRAVRRGSGVGTRRGRLRQHGRPIEMGFRLSQRLKKPVSVGVGGAHSTGEVPETGWREGALVLGAFNGGEDRGDWR